MFLLYTPPESANSILFGIVALVVFIIIFLLCREVYGWYTKQNRIVELLEDISRKLGKDEKQPPKKKDGWG